MTRLKIFIGGAGAVLVVLAGLILALTSGGAPARHSPMAAERSVAGVPGASASSPLAAGSTPAPPVNGQLLVPPTEQASPQQVQQTVAGILAQLQQISQDGNGHPKAVTAEEVEARLRAELAKIGLRP